MSEPPRRGVVGFLDGHRSFGSVTAQPYAVTIDVAASAFEGSARIAVHGRTQGGQSIGGLLYADDARALIENLTAAIEYAESIAATQLVSEIPELERRLAEARSKQ